MYSVLCYKDCVSNFATGAEILNIAIPSSLNIAVVVFVFFVQISLQTSQLL
jgi:hypothetical protein